MSRLSSSIARRGILSAVLLLVAASPAGGATLVQDWEHENFASNGYTARTWASFDPSGITGVGVEQVPVSYLAINILLNGVGQTFLTASIVDPGFFGNESDPYAQYTDGVLQGVAQLDLGGNPLLDMGFGTALGMGFTEMYFFYCCFVPGDRHRLVQSELVTVPEPGTLLFLAPGLLALRRRQDRGHRLPGL